MPVVIDVAAQDFPDAAQRFNWCNCQKEAPRLTSALGQLTPSAAMPSTLGPVTPIFDFSFWEQELTGGGGSMPTNQTGAPGQIVPSGPTVSSLTNLLWPGLLVATAVWILWADPGGVFLHHYAKRGRRR
jgi:hypothetical protein